MKIDNEQKTGLIYFIALTHISPMVQNKLSKLSRHCVIVLITIYI